MRTIASASSPSPSLLAPLLVVLLLLYPPSGCVCFRLGKRGGDAGATIPPSAPPQGHVWKTPQWGRMFAEALGQTNDGSSSGSSKECHAADELMRKRGPEDYRKAAEEYKALLEKEPDRCVEGVEDGVVRCGWAGRLCVLSSLIIDMRPDAFQA